MSVAAIFSLLSALLLSYIVLSAGVARLNTPITPEQIARERGTSSANSVSLRELVGVLDILCGVMLLVPRSRRWGAAVAFVLLLLGLVSRVREGKSSEKALICMGLCAVVWVC